MGWLIAAISENGHFADYHESFGHGEEDIRCKYVQRQSQLHPFSCVDTRPHRARLFSKADRRLLTTREVLGRTQGVKMFAEWAPKNRAISEKKGT